MITKVLLLRYGETFGEEVGVDPESNTPSMLFCLLHGALLFSARISSEIALRTWRVFIDRGWTTSRKLAATTWQQRVDALGEGGYVRYDESTSTMLGETTNLIVERYGGDLRKLREAAGSDPSKERTLLKKFKGIGDVGVDIFFREVQVAWPELYPFADKRVRSSARKLGLPSDPGALAGLVRGRLRFARLTAALMRVELAGIHKEVHAAASAA